MAQNRKPPLEVNPTIGDGICRAIEKVHGVPVHLVMIVMEHLPDGKLGQPSFITSLQIPEMESVVTQIAGGFALAGKPTIKEVH